MIEVENTDDVGSVKVALKKVDFPVTPIEKKPFQGTFRDLLEGKLKTVDAKRIRSNKQEAGILTYRSRSGLGVNLNAVEVKDEKGYPIRCGHFAAYVASQKMKRYHDDLSNAGKIFAVSYLRNNEADPYSRKTSRYYSIAKLDAFGAELERCAQKVPVGHEVTLLFDSPIHTMAITITHKPLAENKSYYVIKFYDPNATDRHIRGICQDTSAVGALKLSDFLESQAIDHYFEESKMFALYSYEKCQSAENKMPDVHICESEETLSESLFYVLNYGLHEAVAMIAKRLSGNFDLLQANDVDGYPGFFMALQEGHTQAIEAYVNVVLTTDALSDDQKFKLLQAKNLEGDSGLFMAFQEGHTQAIKAYIDAVLVTKTLREDQKFELLQAKNSEGDSGLFIALEKGHTEVVEAYIKVVRETDRLEASQKIKLLKSASSNLKKLSTPNNVALASLKSALVLFKRYHEESEDTPCSPVIKSTWV